MGRVLALAVAALITALLVPSCTVTTEGHAVRQTFHRIPVENLGDDTTSVRAQDILTDTVSYWEARGVNLAFVRFVQWDSMSGDAPPLCAGTMYPQPAYCREGWLAWDRAWALRAMKDHALTMYMSRAVADAVTDRLGIPYNPLSAVSIQECMTGALLSGRSDSTSREIRRYLTDLGAYVRGLESDDPVWECTHL